MNEQMALVTKQQEVETAATLYGADKDLAEFCYAVKKVAPWAHDLKDSDVGLVVRRAVAMGLDPLNPHEVQIWRDKRGNVQFQIAYTLMAEWVKAYKGDHTEPRYVALSEAEKDEEGLEHDCMAFYAEFVMKDDLAYAARLMELGYLPAEAREMVTVRGLGAAKIEEYSNPYFAPNGRSPAWKVKKRAMVDAYRCKFGTPTRPEIMDLRRTGRLAEATVEDWEVAEGEMDADARVRLAEASARERNRPEDTRTPEEILAENGAILHGDKDDAEWDAPKPQAAKAEPEPLPIEHPAPQPRPAEEVQQAIRLTAKWTLANGGTWRKQPDTQAQPPDENAIKRLGALLGLALKDDGDKGTDLGNKRHSVLNYLIGKKSGKEATAAEATAMLAWLEETPGTWKAVKPIAAQEARLCLRAEMQERGQAQLPDVEATNG